MRIVIEQEKCVGCGRCTEICPSVFRLSEQGKSTVINPEGHPDVKKAADSCMTEAIHVFVD